MCTTEDAVSLVDAKVPLSRTMRAEASRQRELTHVRFTSLHNFKRLVLLLLLPSPLLLNLTLVVCVCWKKGDVTRAIARLC